MSRFLDGVSDRLHGTVSGITATPMTVAVWACPFSFLQAQFLVVVNATASSFNNGNCLQLGTNGSLSAQARDTSGSISTVTGSPRPGVWIHAAGVFASATSRTAYLDGYAGPTATATRSLVDPLYVTLGSESRDSDYQELHGLIARPAIWAAALTPAELFALSLGASPLSIRRESLVKYWPLGQSDVCVITGERLTTVNNARHHADEPRLWTPKRRIWVPVAASGGQTVETGISAETDAAFGVTIAKRLLIGISTETDSGFAVTRAKRKAVGLNTETDSGFALARRKVKIAGLNTETDSAFATAKAKRYAAGLNTETDTALSVSGSQAILVGIAEAIDTALVVTKRIAKAVGLTTETDSALPVVNATVVAVGQAQETDSAFSVAKLKRKLVGLAREYDTSRKLVQNITVSWGLNFPLIRPMVRNLIQSWRSRRFPWKEPF